MTAKASHSTGQDADKANASNPADADVRKPLTPEAERALAEAAERRRQREKAQAGSDQTAREVGGRDGPDPARYGDWENGGIASDF